MLESDQSTPALLLDLRVMESNLKKMAPFFEEGLTRLRPHFKNHKCVALAMRQIAFGAIGTSCATLGAGEWAAARDSWFARGRVLGR